MYKTLPLAFFTTLTLVSSCVQADSRVLTPEKGGTPNKIFKEVTAPQLKVATYNMAAARVGKLSEVAKAVRSLGAELVALNEVDVNTGRSGHVDQVSELARLTGMHGVFGKAIDFDGGQYGVAVLSEYPVEKKQVFKLPSGDGEQRVLLMVQVHKPGLAEPLLFMTTHLDWQEDPALRQQQIRKINSISIGSTDSDFSEIASRIKILAGDFNDVEGSVVLNELQRHWVPVQVKGLDMRTWPAVNPALDLDHIFTFRGQRWVTESLTVPNQPRGWNIINWPSISDHVPVVAELRLIESMKKTVATNCSTKFACWYPESRWTNTVTKNTVDDSRDCNCPKFFHALLLGETGEISGWIC
jgi:endonuclease/exonuclease/phosphatase family metal-dependent hydrolase